MSGIGLTFTLVPGVRRTDFRAVGFLTGAPAKDAFDGFPEKVRMDLRTYMDEWASGKNGPECRFHGLPNDSKFSEGFTFKAKEKRLRHRLYGYLFHPLPISNPRFQICVLCIHTTKTQKDTDRTLMGWVYRFVECAKAAIAKIFPDDIGQEKGKVLSWKR